MCMNLKGESSPVKPSDERATLDSLSKVTKNLELEISKSDYV